MTVVADTSLVLAAMVSRDEFHADAADLVQTLDDDLVTTPLAVAEMDHMIRGRGGADVQQLLWDNLRSGAIAVRWWADAMKETLDIASTQPGLSLADASLVALCDRLGTDRIATFDTHFDTTTPAGRALVRLPGRKDH